MPRALAIRMTRPASQRGGKRRHYKSLSLSRPAARRKTGIHGCGGALYACPALIAQKIVRGTLRRTVFIQLDEQGASEGVVVFVTTDASLALADIFESVKRGGLT